MGLGIQLSCRAAQGTEGELGSDHLLIGARFSSTSTPQKTRPSTTPTPTPPPRRSPSYSHLRPPGEGAVDDGHSQGGDEQVVAQAPEPHKRVGGVDHAIAITVLQGKKWELINSSTAGSSSTNSGAGSDRKEVPHCCCGSTWQRSTAQHSGHAWCGLPTWRANSRRRRRAAA